MTNVEKINKVLPNGSRWISESTANKVLASEYQKQAVNFLIETKTTCEIVARGLKSPNWDAKRKVNSYDVTLKNARHTYTFEFFDSIKNTEDNKPCTLDFYSVLACIGLDYGYDFDEFCSNFGYEFKTEREYIKIKNIYYACKDQVENLNKLFTEDKLNKLAEIN